MTGPDGDPLCDADGNPVHPGAACRHVDAPELSGHVNGQVSPSKVSVTWHAGPAFPTAQTVTVPAENLIMAAGGPDA